MQQRITSESLRITSMNVCENNSFIIIIISVSIIPYFIHHALGFGVSSEYEYLKLSTSTAAALPSNSCSSKSNHNNNTG